MTWAIGHWVWNSNSQELCQIVDVQHLWGQSTYRVWLPNSDAVIRVPANRLEPLAAHQPYQLPHHLTYVAAAARVADALTQDLLLAPRASSVMPLPHQIRALSRAISGDRVRYLLADEVGLGKTIEAGLILRELKLRGLVTRTLVIAPKGLVTQWVAEMRTHFGEDFRLLVPGDFSAYRHIAPSDNLWRSHPQVICSMDAVKPIDSRRGWSAAQVASYNRERFEDLIAAGWDLVIVDEAHRLGGSTDQVARYKLGQGLAEAAPYLLLLSATPHQGKTDAFHRLLSLLDTEAFPDSGSVTQERVRPYVIRTEKRRAIDTKGKPLFKPRRTQLTPVAWQARHREQARLYDAVTQYVRQGYNQALQEKRHYIGFLMLLMQRLVVSSTRAIRTTLARRLEALHTPLEQLTLFPLSADEWADLDGQEQLDTLLATRLTALQNECAEVQRLLEAARRYEQAGPDAKAEALLEWIYRLQQEESDPELKILIFTEFVPTQEMLQQFLTERGFTVVCLNGAMDMDERTRVQGAFATNLRILISTDAGGEGLNLQFCHVVINYDIPWNPMRLEQRIGRVDRIGQDHTVRAVNFVLQDSVEHRVREVLEEKLAVIFAEFGIDKTGDVLDSAQAGQLFDDLYMEAILHPETLETSAERVATSLQAYVREARESVAVLGATDDLEPSEAQRLISHPLPYWVERMTVSYLQAYGGKVQQHAHAWDLTWPGGETQHNVVFTALDAAQQPAARHLTLEEPAIHGLAMRLPRVAPGQPIPCIVLPGLAADVQGLWSLWHIALSTADWNQQRMMALFLHDDGRILLPTARFIWEQMLSGPPDTIGHLDGAPAHSAYARLREAAEAHGKSHYETLVQAHRARLARAREKGAYAFVARQCAVEKVGLQTVRSHRLAQLAQEERTWHEQLAHLAEVQPELTPLLMAYVTQGHQLPERFHTVATPHGV
jgi:superfamily II DNA or RNA helicase